MSKSKQQPNSSRSDIFVFFRCWPSFDESFPFGLFNHLSDEEIVPALEKYALDWLHKNKQKVKDRWASRKRDQTKRINKQSRRRTGPGDPVSSTRRAAKFDWRTGVRGVGRDAPLFVKVAHYAGWIKRQIGNFGDLPVGPITWFIRTPRHQLVEQLVADLNKRYQLDYEGHEPEYWLQPRFGYVPVETFDVVKQASIQRDINLLEEGKPQVLHADIARDIGRRARKVALELAEAFVEVADRGGGTSQAEVLPALEAPEHAVDSAATGKGAGQKVDDAGKPAAPATSAEKQAKWLGMALLLVKDHPDWSDAEIARRVGVHPSTLSRCPVYQVAAALARGSKVDIPQGHVRVDPTTGQQDVEAYSDSDDPANMDWD
jgi:hypothetical protein